jgi:hypothetical protein
MSWFNTRSPQGPNPEQPPPSMPIAHFDASKRYDVYCSVGGEDRVYENVRFVGIRTFERINEFTSGMSGYLEIEAIDGTRMLIPHFGIHLVCEHGAEPAYRVLRRWGNSWEC